MDGSKDTIYCKYVKRFLDFVISLVAIIVLSPVLAITAFLVKIKLGSPVVFKQARPGKNEEIFYLYKFRSMTNEVGEDGRLLPDSQRLTKFGRFLRASSLDELLELVNIIRGDMSIVGPRPLSIYYLPHFPANYRRRHDIRPGLTGLAQINGRNNLPWDDRFEMDITYVDNVSFLLDVKIVLSTVLKVLNRADITVRGSNKVKDYGPYSILKEESDGGKKVAEMTYSEIGSYYWLNELNSDNTSDNKEFNWLPSMEDSCFTFSGRNAIDLALRDILSNHNIKRVYAPSYSCVSMLQSFIDRELDVEFYNVGYHNGIFTYEIPKINRDSIVLVMSYFGLGIDSAHEAVKAFSGQGAVVIEDITHSLLRETSCSEFSDYCVASLRKWFAIPTGGWVGKKQGMLIEKPDLDSNHAVTEKISGMKEKYKYLIGEVKNKENFLLTQAKFDNDLIHVDRMLKIDDTSISILRTTDVNAVVQKRRSNVFTLMQGLKQLDGKILTLPTIDFEVDTPLFLPIFLKTGERDALRNHLIGKGIYCPVHWPEVMGASVGIRSNELSLICDQRYNEGDMNAIVDAIQEWYQRLTKPGM